ncbi:hypothetical protein GRI35_10575 [Altererythrobacter aestiaquae]|uniref:Uncharacterized protein n=2 Tax=Pontixanthobacter aestiaquae TaxID=1509367 RepID=A0A844Z7M1_9SPHN|nr:beta-propeller domain-containing protein [Pontixanthobacter aestiaquae]MXO83808.1 hypothetical protein [Pontixanthobacter aestiaquae]
MTSGGGDTVPVFASEQAIDRYARSIDREKERIRALYEEGGEADQYIVVTGSRVEGPNITNTQEEGVDEGGIVKATSDFLVVLRRGRLFTIRHGDDQLVPAGQIDVFPPGAEDPDDAWYDEMLVRGNTIVVIGYSYGDDGTEISRFTLADDGGLTYRDTHYVKSQEYYSSRNYASRRIGDTLILYSPSNMNWTKWRESLPSVGKRIAEDEVEETHRVSLDNFHIPQRYVDTPHPDLDTLHTVTRCDLLSEDFECSSQMILGSWSRNFYITRDAVFVWTSEANSWRVKDDDDNPAMLYRFDLATDDVTAIGVRGSPVDQFSFLQDDEDDKLHVVVDGDSYGDAMWGSEFSLGGSALLQLPLDMFGDGSAEAPKWAYRGLPSIEGYRKQNRYVGRHLLYGGGYYGDEDETPQLYVSPIDKGWVQRIELPHGVSRIDMIGGDGFVAGEAEDDALGFSAILLDDGSGTARLGSTFLLPSAEEGENRSQAFFFRPDAGAEDGESGTLALPVNRELDDDRYEFLGRATSLAFLRREDRELKEAGTLDTEYQRSVPDQCVASCTDWYGNARPIFLGERMFALLGYELIEGDLKNGRITERRRIDFAPNPLSAAEERATAVDQ